ncbi:hypothetical protein GCM10010873_36660 [Cypionkella aquatica]|uniref:Uncharacterized protein n=1 Tax=Cypionkella aquatica TaxID=1756042 RepID=A0AA37U3E3_9RHOB|nr:hypothetical protein GCM10010873_36660 [Cypionkella aquatica]
MANRADVDVRFVPFKLCLCHGRGTLSFADPESSPVYTGGQITLWHGEIKGRADLQRDLRQISKRQIRAHPRECGRMQQGSALRCQLNAPRLHRRAVGGHQCIAAR